VVVDVEPLTHVTVEGTEPDGTLPVHPIAVKVPVAELLVETMYPVTPVLVEAVHVKVTERV